MVVLPCSAGRHACDRQDLCETRYPKDKLGQAELLQSDPRTIRSEHAHALPWPVPDPIDARLLDLGTALAAAGCSLEAQYSDVADWLNPATNAVIGAAAPWYPYQVITFQPERA